MTPTCGREGCEKPLPRVAIKHGDPFCSTACAKITFGTMTVTEADVSEQRAEAGRVGASMGGLRARSEQIFINSRRGTTARPDSR